jgi:hypothetical protein
MSGRRDAGSAVQLASGIALPGDLCLSRVKAHAYLDGAGGQRFLPRGRSRERRLRVSEDIEERIALRVDLQASVRGEGRTQGTAVLGQRFDVALLAEFLDQSRRALDVGEEECDGPGRER